MRGIVDLSGPDICDTFGLLERRLLGRQHVTDRAQLQAIDHEPLELAEDKFRTRRPETRVENEWLLKPGLLESEFRADPAGVFTQVVRDEGKSIQTLQLKRRVIDLGLSAEEVNAAFTQAKPLLAKNRHLVIQGAKHSWSDQPVDPYADLRSLPPHTALDQLLSARRLKPEQKEALADAVRAALPPR